MPSDRAKKKAAPTKKPNPSANAPKDAPNDGCRLNAVLLELPPALTPRQRAVLHELGEAHGLQHASSGEGPERHISLGHAGGKQVHVDGQPTDAELCALLLQHLGIDDAAVAFGGGSSGGSAAASRRDGTATASTSKASSKAGPGGKRPAPSAAAERADISLEEYVTLTRTLLELERLAEVAQATESTSLLSPETAQARGRTILNLRCTDTEGGLMGRTLITLVSNRGYGAGGPPAELPAHKFGPHDVVALRPSKAAPGAGPPLCQGVVYRLRDTTIVVAVDEAPEEGLDQPLRLEKLANEVTYKRLKETLDVLARGAEYAPPGGGGGGAQLVDVMFGKRAPRFQDAPPPWKAINLGLDDSQRRAVSRALAAKDVALIHGPPGTGKTTTVVEFVLQEVARGSRVLVCAASNIAVDNLVERLVVASPKAKILRMGHPARLLPQVLESSMEAAVLRSDNSSLAKDCRKEIKELSGQLTKLAVWKKAERRQVRQELRVLAKEERVRQQAAVKEVIAATRVLCCTLTGASHPNLQFQKFDVVVVDEAAQALEAATWSALLKAPRCVMAGDHLQLPPTVVSDEALRRGLGRTLFERLQVLYGDAAGEMLTVQYRMNTHIMQWSSDELYQGLLSAHESVATHTLGSLHERDAGGAASTAAADLPVLLLIDTAGCDMEEEKEEEGDSTANSGEAKVVMAHVQRLVSAGIPATAIGIITPYNAQVALLKGLRPAKLAASLEISSVDGFQGREKEAIIITMVRSNSAGGVGFLADRRRMNVAVTRARRHCAIVCDSETVSHDPFLKRLVAYFEEHGEYSSAAELLPG